MKLKALKKTPLQPSQRISVILITLILLAGAFFRFYGIRWDQEFHLHPDERFLTMVASSIRPVSGLGEYFDTHKSLLNPHNIVDGNGNSVFPFFVYGTLPLFIVRYTGELLGQTGYGQIHIVGRYLSGIFDLGTVVLIYLIAVKMFPRRKWIPLTAAFLYSCSVLPIQISHFFIVDNFTTFFSVLAVYACVRISMNPPNTARPEKDADNSSWYLSHWGGFGNFALFSIALGMAAASKINAIVIAVLLPVSVLICEGRERNKINFSFREISIRNIFLSAICSFLVFRIFQPYAFNGPGFLQIVPNSRWINNLKELSVLSSGDSNYPPSLQWARRSLFFPLKNLAVWGLGLPLGVFSLAGFVFMGVKVIINEQWKDFRVIWLFTGLYLAWQVSLWNPTMRYFLLIYPFLAIMAAWLLCELIEIFKVKFFPKRQLFLSAAAVTLSVVLVLGTLLWAFAFMEIYRQPMTRIAASEWIYENIEGAVNLSMRSDGRDFLQPLPNTHHNFLSPEELLAIDIQPEISGELINISFDHIVRASASDENQILLVELVDLEEKRIIQSKNVVDTFKPEGDSRGRKYDILLDESQKIQKDKKYLLNIKVVGDGSGLLIFGSIDVSIKTPDLVFSQSIFTSSKNITSQESYSRSFMPIMSGELTGIELFRINNFDPTSSDIRITIQISDRPSNVVIAEETRILTFATMDDYRGNNLIIDLADPVPVEENHTYLLTLSINNDQASIFLNGSKTAKETDWDDALPLFMHGLNPFDNYEGVYPSDLNFQMYWDDNQEKLESIIRILYQADYFFITSNRQWGSTTQIPERYPLTSLFYKELIGCPDDDVQKCYRNALPGMYDGTLGFDLVKTFQSNPGIFGMEFNSQYAEEAFTVYDHPKVLIFQKNADFDIQQVAERLSQPDLNHVLNLTPKEADRRPGNLMLVESQVEKQAGAGTWSEIFNSSALINTSPIASVVVWYVSITLLGWLVMPVVRLSFSGLSDKGYSLLRPIGILLLSLIVWLAGSLGVSVTKNLIIFVLLFLLIVNIHLFFRDKKGIIREIGDLKKHIILVEIISLLLFLIFLTIRAGNPDLWHPYKGGEKPMDFSYLNAVIKSVNFPPYDPWFAGGYINYYYFGFVLAAVPIKFLGIIPSIGYNLVLASFFSFTGLAAFSLLWNLAKKKNEESSSHKILDNPNFYGCLGILFVLVIGNFGTIMMIIDGLQRIAIANMGIIPGMNTNPFSLLINGFKLYIEGFKFPYYPGDWYWIPSRTIPGEPITEFPFFTFLYGDPHAHLFAYPFTLIALCWVLSILFSTIKISARSNFGMELLIGAVLIGALRVTNTWDYPIHLVLACSALIFLIFQSESMNEEKEKTARLHKIVQAFLVAAGFILTINIVYSPFIKWFGQGYSSIKIWEGDKTPLGSYLIHWGYFLFIIASSVIFRLIRWMSRTPLSLLKPFYLHRKIFFSLFLLSIALITYLIFLGLEALIVIFPLALICLVLFIFDSPNITQKIILIFTGVALAMTFFVEIAVLDGDIGRMNTVFKFYLQAWTFFAAVSAFLLPELLKQITVLAEPHIKKIWFSFFILLTISSLLFPVFASADKMSDRISAGTQPTIDGMEYMKNSTYIENEIVMDLEQDYHAIRWAQENIKGTPVIVEANIPEYRWGNRFTIYTGLPGVLGWNWHQRQQRAINPAGMVLDRVADINTFYSSDDLEYALRFIRKYNIEYIVVGQLERALYPESGIEKFVSNNQHFWDLVYSDRLTNIYRVKKNWF